MPIRDLQITLREVGRIRCGDQVQAGRGKAPRKLDRFRFTTDDDQLIGIIAELYGGKPAPWADAPGGQQWQCYVTADRIPVMLVPGLGAMSQWWEAWTGGGCVRRCDGEWEKISGASCLCKANDDQACKPTSRLNVLLPDVPGLGTWRLESHGYYAAIELGGTMELITRLVAATREPVRGTLRLSQRSQRVTGQPVRHFSVPTLDVNVTIPDLVARLAAGELQDDRPIDASNATRLQELAASHDRHPSGFMSATERAEAEDRGLAKALRKRTPQMGPGRRDREPSPVGPQPVDEGRYDSTKWGALGGGVAPEEVRAAFDSPISSAQIKALQTLFRMTGLDDRDERLGFSARIIGRSINTSKDLTSREASQIIDVMAAIEQGTAEYVTDQTGRIIGAHPLDTATPEIVHDDSLSEADDPPDE